MSDINFCNTKEQLNHLGEVVTGKVDGSPTGADIDTSTLPYTGQVRKTLPALEEEYQADIDNFVQVSDQVIVDKTSEFDTSIANKEAEADAAFEAQRNQFDATFQAQFKYKKIGNISNYAGQQLQSDDKLNAYQFPDDSGNWYAPLQGLTFPITIPSNPESSSEWVLTALDTVTADGTGVTKDLSAWMGKLDTYSFESESVAKSLEQLVDFGSLISIKGGEGEGYITYSVEEATTEGNKDTPDYIMLSTTKRAVRVKSNYLKFSGIFSSPPALNHRAGQLVYKKKSHTEAELLTDLSGYIPYTIDNENDAGLVVAYADWNKGNNNSGDGLSWDNAKGSIQSAIGLNPDILLIRAGQYNRVNRLNYLNVTKDMSIISVGGASQVSMMATGSWSSDSRANVYKLTYASGLTNTTYRVFDDGYLTNKTATVYQSVASADDVELTPGSWWHDATNDITYVRAIDDRDLITEGDKIRLTQNVTQSTITFTGNYKLYMDSIEFWGGSGQVEFRSDGSEYLGASFYGRRCKFNGNTDGGGNGFAMRDIGLSINYESESSLNRRDGFNYHYYLAGATGVEGVSPHFIEINCKAHNNGLGGSEGNNQGSTAHEKSVGLRIGGDYSYHQDGGCVVDIESVNCLMVSNNCCESSKVGGALAADGAFPTPANWWVDGMLLSRNGPIGNGGGDLAIDGYNSTLHMRDVVSDKVVSVRDFSNVVNYSW